MSESWPSVPPAGSWWAESGARIGAGIREADALSTIGARAAAFVVVALAFGALADTTGRFDVLAWSGAALWVGIALGEIREVRSVAARMPGWVIGLLGVGLVVFVWVLLAAREVVEIFPPHVLLLAVVGAGLDWAWVTRLRGYILGSGFLVVPLVFEPDRGDVLLALAWLVGAIAALWFIQRDSMSAWPHARPLRTGGAPAHSDDLFWVAGAAVALGVLAALLLGNPSCRAPWQPPTENVEIDSGRFDESGRLDPGAPGSLEDRQGGRVGEDPAGRTGSGEDRGGSGRAQPGQGSGRVQPGEDELGGSGSTQGGSGFETDAGDDVLGDGTDEGGGASVVPILLAVLAAVALGALLFWLVRRREPPVRGGGARSWAIELSRRLAVEGARRGRPRLASETITSYAGALGEGPWLPDPRLGDVGVVLSAALFGRAEPPESSRAWAEQVVGEAVDQHPLSGKRTEKPG